MKPHPQYPDFNPKTLVEMLRLRADKAPENPVFTYLPNGEEEGGVLTFEELDRKCRALGAYFQSLNLNGERALMLYPAGLEYIAAYFGCLYGNVIAVPAYPPDPTRLNRTLPRLQSILKDAKAKVVLTTSFILDMFGPIRETAPDLAALEWIATDKFEDGPTEGWKPPKITSDNIAFLQYTSGSTGDPKGVMVSHGNLLDNSWLISTHAQLDASNRSVCWLPNFHDMGLIEGLIQPIYNGARTVIMPPTALLQKPLRWMKAITKYRATMSGGPNFAWDLCARKITPEQRQDLDLSSWRVGYNGAEPVRIDTMARFTAAFAECGFRPEVKMAAYGMAESTLFITATKPETETTILNVSSQGMEMGEAIDVPIGDPNSRGIISCGISHGDTDVRIVNLQTLAEQPERHVGEIWTRGSSVAKGYWGREETTKEIFGAMLSNSGEGPFLRTGDTGFMASGELFVTGRVKDLIIIRGRNHYPQDIEVTMEHSSANIRPGCCAVFSIDIDGEEQLICTAEVDNKRQPLVIEDVFKALREDILEHHEVSPHTIALLKPKSIHKTSSGKIQRNATKAGFIFGTLAEVARSENLLLSAPKRSAKAKKAAPTTSKKVKGASGAMEAWLVGQLSDQLGLTPSEIDVEKPFNQYGLDSKSMVGLSGDLSDALKQDLSPTVLYNYPNVRKLAEFLTGQDTVGEIASEAEAWRQMNEPVAIIGIGCRYPGNINSPESFWKLLEEGVDAVGEIPEGRWDVERYYDPTPGIPGKMYTKWGGFLKDVDQFDASYFGIAPREASAMDPQQRLLLEVSNEALAHAGIASNDLDGSNTGVYVGVSSGDYATGSIFSGDNTRIDAYSGTGNSFSVAAGRISYLLGLQGPAVSMDTACSSSLVSVHLACQSLRAGESDLALAGGVNLILNPQGTIYFSQLKAMSKDGRCKTFDDSANGYVRAEGCGMIVLKRLADAQKDGDRILAVVKGSAVNQDGRSNGLTAPNGVAQQKVLMQALASAGIQGKDVDYMEAHGTGTPLGDPIELKAIGAAYGKGRDKETPLQVGSIKSNFGHAESAAGIAGLIKSVLSLQNETIPANLHFETPSKHIPWDELPVAVPTAAIPWKKSKKIRAAGISSFGFSGTNAHIVVSEAPPVPAAYAGDLKPARLPAVVPLSARSDAALQAMAGELATAMTTEGGPELKHVIHTLGNCRNQDTNRLAVTGESVEDIAESLRAFEAEGAHTSVSSHQLSGATRHKLVLVFPGQGSQWLGMAQELLENEPVFRNEMKACDRAISKFNDWSLLEELAKTENPLYLNRIDVIQPTLWAVDVSIAALWRSWGVEPDAVIGHSMGEVAAAYVAGNLSIDDAACIICRRSVLLRTVSGQGVMAVVELDQAQAQARLKGLEDKVSVAVVNSPRSTVISGDPDAVDSILAKLEAENIFCRKVKVDVASHSPQMDPLKADLIKALADIKPQEGDIPMYSTVTGKIETGLQQGADYWEHNLRDPVQFARMIEQLKADGHTLFIEASPHPVLLPAIQAMLRDDKTGNALAVGSLRREQPERRSLLEGLGALYTRGYDVDWSLQIPSGGLFTDLPAYAWQKERYWQELQPEGGGSRHLGKLLHPLLGAALPLSVNPGKHYFENSVQADSPAWLVDHKVQEAVVLPGAAYIELALAAARESFGAGAYEISGLSFSDVMSFPEGQSRTVQVVLGNGGAFQTLSSGPDGNWTSHATGTVKVLNDVAAPSSATPEQIKADLSTETTGEDHYKNVGAMGLNYGEAFQGVQQVWSAEGRALAQLTLPEKLGGQAAQYIAHPALIDAAFQVMSEALGSEDEGGPAVPVSVQTMTVYARPEGELFAAVNVVESDDKSVTANINILDSDGQVLVSIAGLRAQRLEAAAADKEEIFLSVQWNQVDTLEAPENTQGPGRWLVFADQNGQGSKLAESLKAAKQDVVIVSAKGREVPGSKVVNAEDLSEMKALFTEVFSDGVPCKAIAYLWSLDAQSMDSTSLTSLHTDIDTICGGALHLTQTVPDMRWRHAPRIYLVTRNAQGVSGGESVSATQNMIWGLTGTLGNEHAEYQATRIDLPSEANVDDALVTELLSATPEDVVALRDDGRFVGRILPLDVSSTRSERMESANGRAYRLEVDQPGVLGSLVLRETAEVAPGPGEVRIAVEAASLNFRDVMMAMGFFTPEDGSIPLGGECAGKIVAIGEGVEGLSVGQSVLALANYSFASHVTTPASLVVGRPDTLSPAEGSAVPSVFTTAWYALYDVARLVAEDSVLIHSGTGGTGMAAIQLAKRIGATVYATAGSPEKRQYLRDSGIEHVFDSRSTDFADEILKVTGGRGVDVILNSLSGTAIDAGLRCLASDGRFLELGKRDIYDGRPLDMSIFKRRITYTGIDLAGLATERPERFRQLLDGVLDAFAKGELKALPTEAVDIADVQDIFRTMAQAKHIGKLVATLGDGDAQIAVTGSGASFRDDASYLITGGLGGLGLSAAQWMVENGARNLLLTGRRGVTKDSQTQAIATMEAAGATVMVGKADVAIREQLLAVLDEAKGKLPPLKGVLHAAGVLEDGMLLQQDLGKFHKVMGPKIDGAWNLHELTSSDQLDFFVLYSSAASLLGSPGQGNYAAANSFLDGLAHQRKAEGKAGLSINWGAFAEVGLAAEQANRAGRLMNRGMRSLTPGEGNDILGQLMASGQAQVGVVPLNVRQWIEFYPQAASAPLLSELVKNAKSGAKKTGDAAMRKTLEAAPSDEHLELLERFLQEQVSAVLRLDASKISRTTPLKNLGIDSLMGMELRNRMESGLGLTLSATLIWTYPTVAALADHLLGLMDLGEVESAEEATIDAAEAQAQAEQAAFVESLEEMDDDETAALIEETLADTDDDDEFDL